MSTLSNPHQRGPRLVDYALWLIREHGLNNSQVHKRFGTGKMWLSQVESGYVKSPASDTIQLIIEELSGVPLVPPLNSPAPAESERVQRLKIFNNYK